MKYAGNSDEKRAGDAVLESEAKYRDLADLLPQMIFEMDTDFRITYANRHALTVFGITGKDLENGIHALSFIDPSQHARVKENAQKQLNGIPVDPQEYTTLRKDGSTFQVTIYTSPIYKNETITGLRGVIVDISEQKKIEEELRESEEKYRLVVENSYNAIYIYRDSQILFANRRATDLTGFTSDDLMGMNIWDLVHPDDRARLQDSGRRRISGSDLPANFTGRIIKKSSEVLDCEFFVTRILYQGQPAILGIIRDITEQKYAEDALRLSQKNFRTVLDNLPDLVLVHRDGLILYVNPAMTHTLDIKPEEVLKKPILDYIAPEFHPRVAAAIRERIKTGQDNPYEIEILPRKAGRRTVLIRGSVIEFDGSPAILNVLTDITERRKAERALLESEEKFRSIVETSPDMIWEIDPQGKFRYISPMVKTIMGFSPEELVGKPITDLIPEQQRSFIMRELGQHISSEGRLSPLEVPARHRNGHDMVIEIRSLKVIGPDGKINGLQGVARDITERKKAEDTLRKANRQLSLLSGITRHDILNKISVILGFIKISEKKFNDPALGEYLRKMESATTDIRSQIEFTRVYQDLGTHAPQWIDLDTVMPRLHVPSTITLNADVKSVEIYADPMLEKVFFNLLDNSIRHGERVTEIRVSSCQSGEYLDVVWEDNGVGIAAKEKERIFERGFGKHTGLGMFLVREILSLTGITIKETGVPGIGVRFEINIPQGKYRLSGRQTLEM
jgi:PAS domain S-box-containing protein